MIAVSARDPFAPAGLARRGAPFLAILLLGFVLFLAESPRNWWYFTGAALVAVVAVAAAALVPWHRLPRIVGVLVPLGIVLSIALLREGQGGSLSGYGALFLLPTLWAASYSTRTQLLIVLGAVLTAYWLPIVVVGSPYYPSSQWRGGGLLVLIVGLFGFVIQQLLHNLTAEAERRADAERRLRQTSAYELHDDVVQNLTVAQLALAAGDVKRARTAVSAALEVGQAIVQDLLSAHAPRPGSFVRRETQRGAGGQDADPGSWAD
jgi:signal transduction histidine kinase